MKKIFALILSLVMIMSMAAVSFAAYGDAEYFTLFGPLWYDEDEDEFYENYGWVAEYGETIYWELWDNDYKYRVGRPITDHNEVEKLKVKFTAETGEDLIESVKLVKMRTANQYYYDDSYDGAYGEYGDKYYSYYIAMEIADKETTSEADIIGEFELNRKKDTKNGIEEIDELKIPVEVPVFYIRNWNDYAEEFLVKDEVNLKYDDMYALKFDSDEEVELNFGGKDGFYGDEQNEGTFTVDASGQGKVFIKWNTEPNEAIAAANEGAEMYFVNFGGVKFNRAGEYVYELDDVAAAYQVVDGKLADIPGVVIEDGEVSFRTNILGSYVFAKSELVNP